MKRSHSTASSKDSSLVENKNKKRNLNKSGSSDLSVYKPGEVVVAKVKGYPYWPAKIIDSPSNKMYAVRFYSTEQTANVSEKNIFSFQYYKENIKIPQNNKSLNEALMLVEKELSLKVQSQNNEEDNKDLNSVKPKVESDVIQKELQVKIEKVSELFKTASSGKPKKEEADPVQKEPKVQVDKVSGGTKGTSSRNAKKEASALIQKEVPHKKLKVGRLKGSKTPEVPEASKTDEKKPSPEPKKRNTKQDKLVSNGYSAFSAGDKVFAKLRGYRPWPAKIEKLAGGNKRYHVTFYGDKKTAIVQEKDICLFSANKRRLGRSGTNRNFAEAMKLIQKD